MQMSWALYKQWKAVRLLLLTGAATQMLSCQRTQEPTVPIETKPSAIQSGPTSLPPPSIKVEMQRVALFTDEIRRRIHNGISVSGPGHVIAKIAEQLSGPLSGQQKDKVERPAAFISMSQSLRQKALDVSESNDPKRAFNTMLVSCNACHNRYMPGVIERTKAYEIP